MAQTVWKGAVSFGLVSIPVRLVSATEERDLSFHQVRVSDGSRVRYRRVAEADGEEVPYAQIAKSYTTPDGREVVLTDEDLAAVRIPSSRTVELIGFVDGAEIDPVTLGKSYFAEPAADDRKPYALLRDALVASGRVAVIKIAIRNRERLGVLRPRGEVLVLQTMLWPDEVRTPDFATDAGSAVRPQELTMAESYIDALSGELDLSDQTDQYRQALMELVDAKAQGIEPTPEPDPDGGRSGAQVVDLVEALRRSVEAAGGRRARAAGAEASGAGTAGAGTAAAGGVAAGKAAAGGAHRPAGGGVTRTKEAPGTRAVAGKDVGTGTSTGSGTGTSTDSGTTTKRRTSRARADAGDAPDEAPAKRVRRSA